MVIKAHKKPGRFSALKARRGQPALPGRGVSQPMSKAAGGGGGGP